MFAMVVWPTSASAQTGLIPTERYPELVLPSRVAIVDSGLDPERRQSARLVLQALEAVGRGPDLVLGTRSAEGLLGCNQATACGPPFARWVSRYGRVPTGHVVEAFDRVFDSSFDRSVDAYTVVARVEHARRIPLRAYGGLSPVEILVFPSRDPTSTERSTRAFPDDVTIVPLIDTTEELVAFACSRASGECEFPAPSVTKYEGQGGFRIPLDGDGRPNEVTPIAAGDVFGSVPGTVDVAVFTPYVNDITLEWSGGDRAAAHLLGRNTADIVDGYYDIEMTLDGEPVRYQFDGTGLITTLPERGPGRHVLEVRISGGHLLQPLTDRVAHDVDWIVELGNLAPGDTARCVPAPEGFGEIGPLPTFLHVRRGGDEICGSVSLASLSSITEWPRWVGDDGVTRVLQLYASPSPIFWVVFVVLFGGVAFASRRALYLLSLRRRPTHVVVTRRDEANYRHAGGPERVVRLEAGSLGALAPELTDLEVEIEIGAVVTVTSRNDMLVKLRTTGTVRRARRMVLPAGSAIAVDEMQVAFVDAETADRIIAREFRALPVFSNAELAGEGSDDKREVGPLGEAIVYALPVTAAIVGLAALASAFVPLAGTHLGFAGVCVALFAVGLATSRVWLSRG
jgi:hypothetical protein